MNPFLQVLAAADEARRTHHQREAEQTREHFARHPECRKIITAMDADGYASRAKGEIDIDARCRPGWFKESMWKGNYYQAERPVEAVVEGVEETIWVGSERGGAEDVHKFMRSYLRTLQHPSQSVVASTPASQRRAHKEPTLTAIATMI